MRWIASVMVLIGALGMSRSDAGSRRPVLVTSRPVYVATVHCVTIKGVDYDLEPILLEYRSEWTWPGATEQTLREHLAREHQVTGIESLTFAQVRKLHAVLHERAKKVTVVTAAPQQVLIKASPSRCPGGVCPTQPRRFLLPRRSANR